jgi:TetR/AcrR family transcriptional regulator, repressor of fatR-cypB operon
MARERKFSTEDLFSVVEKILLENGYESLTFGRLADDLHISRGAIYKYYDNKEDLVLEYMIHKMRQFFNELKLMENEPNFEAQFDYLFQVMFRFSAIVQILVRVHLDPFEQNEKLAKNKEKMDQYHMKIYKEMEQFIQSGKEEGILREDLPNQLILAMILQTVVMPNHFQIPQKEWMESIKSIIRHGMFKK